MLKLYAKLLAIQKEIKPILREEENDHFHSSYYDINGLLAAVKPIVNAYGVLIIQMLQSIEGKPFLKTLIVDSDSGEFLESSTALPEGVEPQKMGAAISYYRRYALTAFFALEGEDDDANAVSGKQPTPALSPAGTQRICVTCKKPFNPKPGQEGWAKTCTSCYIKAKNEPKPAQEAPVTPQEVSPGDMIRALGGEKTDDIRLEDIPF
jgi:hypothetical protein